MIRSLLLAVSMFVSTSLLAGEGMWLPHLLKMLNEAEMQSLGMKMTAEDIYSVNQGSLKDAIVHFGGFCTGEVISSNGLVLTNHHCGYGNIQSHSSIDNNLLKNGFWAADYAAELPNPGLFVTFIDRIDDISDIVLSGVKEGMATKERQSIIDKNIADYRSKQTVGEFEDLIIRPFFHGNQYFVFRTLTYEDVRLVGTPPESIGKFGADTDNWVWPRHTGDFSLFRIYAGPDNRPAAYNEENKPFQPKHHLPVSLDGVEEGDFTLVFGFPGRTNEYLPASAIEQTIDVVNPARISVRDEALKILDKHMRADEGTRLKYASKFASVANYWKKWIGENQGLKRTNAVDKKKKLELDFVAKSKANAGLLSTFDKLYKEKAPLAEVQAYYGEVTGRNIELMSLMRIVSRMITIFDNNGADAFNGYKGRVVNYLDGFYKDYEPGIDQEVFTRLVDLYKEKVAEEYTPQNLRVTESAVLADEIYGGSAFASKEAAMALLNGDDAKAIISKVKMDPAYVFYQGWSAFNKEKVSARNGAIQTELDSLQRLYMAALMEAFPDRTFYPDANSTMRVTYGNVKSYEPRDAVRYTPVTYLDGVMEKYVPGDYEFDVSEKLIELYDNKDYGDYADKNGKMPVCFIGSNHTTGGNSGSPAIDAHGNLIGLNFDRAWEGTMSDINYDPSICRNIMVDARYILFIVDKYAGAQRLIDEMTLVHPKAAK